MAKKLFIPEILIHRVPIECKKEHLENILIQLELKFNQYFEVKVLRLDAHEWQIVLYFKEHFKPTKSEILGIGVYLGKLISNY